MKMNASKRTKLAFLENSAEEFLRIQDTIAALRKEQRELKEMLVSAIGTDTDTMLGKFKVKTTLKTSPYFSFSKAKLLLGEDALRAIFDTEGVVSERPYQDIKIKRDYSEDK